MGFFSGLHLIWKQIMYHMADILWIYFKFSKTHYCELNHFKPSESRIQIELITYGYYKNEKCTIFFGMQNIARILIYFLSFFIGLNSHIESTWDGVIYGMCMREKTDQADWKKILNRTAVSILLLIGIIGMLKWRNMRWQGV